MLIEALFSGRVVAVLTVPVPHPRPSYQVVEHLNQREEVVLIHRQIALVEGEGPLISEPAAVEDQLVDPRRLLVLLAVLARVARTTVKVAATD